MRGNFSESPIVQIINTVADLAILSILWTISSLPIVTVGLAGAALYHTVELVIVQGSGTILSVFTRSLRENWRCALPLGILFGICSAAAAFVAYVSSQSEGGVLILQFLPCIAVLLFLITLQIYLYPLLGHFVLTPGQLMVMSLQLTLLHPLRSLLLLMLFLCTALAALYYPPLLMLAPASYMFVAAKIFAPLFSRYIRISTGESGQDGASPTGCTDYDFKEV